MSEPDTRPTPASGTPAAVAATSAATPSSEELAAPKSESPAVLILIQDIQRTVKHLADEVTSHGRQLAELASAQISTAKAASAAAEIAAVALAKANSSQDENAKMVQSAMAIQKGAIETAVREAVQPILKDVERQNEALGAVVDELGIEDRVELGRKMKPGEKPPERALQKIERRAKSSTLVQLVISIAIIVQAIWSIATSHH
jgi:hypothetical protein